MKHIIKNLEPNSLRDYRIQTPNASYPMRNKRDVQKSLLAEQGHICAYCMRRISLKRDIYLGKPKIEIEHYRSQKRQPNLALNYANMLGVCNGNAGKAKHKLICDKSKADPFDKKDEDGGQDLFINPQSLNSIRGLKYNRRGEIYSDDDAINYDLDVILNLNEDDRLKASRTKLYIKVKGQISVFWAKAKGDKTKVKELLLKEKECWESRIPMSLKEQEQYEWTNREAASKFQPLCGVPLYLINKALSGL